MEAFLQGVAILADPYNLFLIFAATLGGLIIGILPGLGSTMATALLLPFTIGMDPTAAICMLAALYCSATYGGAITAILINTPGTGSSAATTLDGYPMAQKGEAGRALGMAVVASVIGGMFSLVVLITAAPALARLAYNFGPPEYFALALFGLSMLASISAGSAAKNLLGGALGVLIATVGVDVVTAVERFTFGMPELLSGIHFIPVLIGIFAISELLVQSEILHYRREKFVDAVKAVELPSWDDIRRCRSSIARSSVIGVFIGILPAEGTTVAALIGYNEAKRWSKNKANFGYGEIEGVAAAEAANNAGTGGAMVPTLALGIPGSGTTAVILGGLLALGLRPGPHLFTEQPEFVYAIFASMFVANILFVGMGLLGAKLFARVTLVPNMILWPTVFLLAVLGAYSLDQSFFDVWVMLAAGLLGYFMRRYGFSVIPVAMGLILGELVETTLRQSLIVFDSDWTLFFTRPITVTFFVLTVLALMGPQIFSWIEGRRWRDKAETADELSE
jgi:putative tricarboxylic transport membrane protein